MSQGVKVVIVTILVLVDLAPPVVTSGNAQKINVGIRNLQTTDRLRGRPQENALLRKRTCITSFWPTVHTDPENALF